MKLATFLGSIKAYASELNPFQTIVEFVLTDFEPNKNKQRIPKEEAQNIVASAQHMPIKINFDNNTVRGHAYSTPIGTLADVWVDEDVIRARSIIWKDEFPQVDQFLRQATSEGKTIGTSWEIYYSEARENNGITDLHGCVLSATTIVDNPAYGERTKILSIAESLSLMEELEVLRTSFSNMLYVLDELYAEAVNQEIQKTAIEDAETAISRIKELFSQLKTSSAEVVTENENLKTQLTTLEDTVSVLTARVTELENEKAEAERKRVEAEVSVSRRESLASAGVTFTTEDWENRKPRYLSMAEETFQSYVEDLKVVSRGIVSVPDTIASSKITPKEIGKALKEGTK
jgi:hypothetical protein